MASLLEFGKDIAPTSTYAGKCIYEHRIARGRTAQSVANALKISQPYLSQIENGLRSGPPATLHKLAVELGIDEEEIYTAYLQDAIDAAQARWRDEVEE